MKIVVTIASLAAARGGPARSVPALCRALADEDANVEIVTIREPDAPQDDMNFGRAKVWAITAESDRYHPGCWARASKVKLS